MVIKKRHFQFFLSHLIARLGITEFYNSTQGDGWIELYNSGPLPVNLRNYYLSDVFGNTLFFTFDDRFINCGEFLIVTDNIQQFQNDFLIQGDSQLLGKKKKKPSTFHHLTTH